MNFYQVSLTVFVQFMQNDTFGPLSGQKDTFGPSAGEKNIYSVLWHVRTTLSVSLSQTDTFDPP